MPSEVKQQPVEESHDEQVITMSSVSERDTYFRVFPEVMPGTHELCYRWDHSGPASKLIIGPRRKDGDHPAGKKADPSRQFDGKTPQDLITMGTELGLELNPNMSVARMRALILEKQRGTPDPNAPTEMHKAAKKDTSHAHK